MASTDLPKEFEHKIYIRDGFMCKYCGFDGRPFPGWLQLTLDHVLPPDAGGKDDIANIVTACRSCRSIAAEMKFEPGTSRDEAFREKRNRIRERQTDYFEFWKENISSKLLDFWRK